MEVRPHVVVLRKNLVYLKEHLEVGEVLDHLYQEGIFTQPEYNRCKQAGPDKCGTILDLLMKKGEDGYKSLCAVLDRAQPHIKEQLDRTSTDEGATSQLFVNKPKIEQQHRAVLSKKERRITELQEEISTLREELDTKTKELEEAQTAQEEDRERHLAELEEEKKKFESNLEKGRGENEKVREDMKKWEEKCKSFEEKVDDLQKALSDERELYEAFTHITRTHISGTDDNTETAEMVFRYNITTCIFDEDSVCDKRQLLLLPCLHAACKHCIEHHIDPLDQGRLLCPCGAANDVNVEELPVDHVRRNEAAYDISKDSRRLCSYMEHDHGTDAVSYCEDCEDFLCHECQNVHDKPKKNKHHRCVEIHKIETIPIRKWLKEKTCQDHPEHKLELYDNSCMKAVCIVCSQGTHKQHDKDDLQLVYEKTAAELEQLLTNLQFKLESIWDLANAVKEHQTRLLQTAEDLETEVVSVHQDVAGKFLHRQKQLIQDIRLSLEGPSKAVHEKLEIVRAAEQSIKSTIDYIRQVIKSTTKTELISLSDVVQKKSAEDLKIELPSDDIRDTRVRLSFQGQKALEEIIDEFGSLATCTGIDKFTDFQPTIRDQGQKIDYLTNRLSLANVELQNAWEEMSLDKERIKKLQFVKGIPVFIVAAAEEEADDLGLVSCPAMTFDRGRVYWMLDVVENDLEMVNWVQSGLGRHRDQFRMYQGTCSRLPIPLPPFPSTLTATRYWESETQVQVKVKASVWSPTLLEMGVCSEGKIDTECWTFKQSRSWAVCVGVCDKHECICTQVWEEGSQCGVCQTDTLTSTPGTDITLRYGCVLDVGRGRLAFIDVDREIVLHKFDANFTKALRPVFGLWPGSDDYTINMKLVSGGDINMTDRKKALIFTALS